VDLFAVFIFALLLGVAFVTQYSLGIHNLMYLTGLNHFRLSLYGLHTFCLRFTLVVPRLLGSFQLARLDTRPLSGYLGNAGLAAVLLA
jgi:hypothetical protein